MERNLCGNCGHFIPSLDMCACEDSPECGELVYENSEACEKFLSLEGALSSDKSKTKKRKIMSKRSETTALKFYPVKMTPLIYQDLIDQFGGKTEIDVNTYPRCLFQQGYEQAEKDILSIIESRLSELLGDAQPTPALRAELQDLIKKIKEEE